MGMNRDIAEGKWEQIKGSIQESWGRLTNDDLDVIEGNRQKLAGRIQERYGKSREEAQREAEEFWKRYPV